MNQWRASSPTRVLAVRRRVPPASADLAVRTSPAGWTKVLVQSVLYEGVGEDVATCSIGKLPYQRDRCRAASRMSSSSSSVFPVARARTSRSKSRPMTAAMESTCSAAGPSRPTRAPITIADTFGQGDLLGVGPTPSIVRRCPGRWHRSLRGVEEPRSRRMGCRPSRYGQRERAPPRRHP